MKNILCFVFTLLLCQGGVAYAGDFMSADEVKALVSGKTTYGKGLKRDFTVVTYFESNGTMVGTKNGDKRTGTWLVENDGKHCVEFDDGKGNCRYVVNNGDGTYSKIKVKGNGKEIAVVLWETIKDGNTVE